ncbi:MAG: alkaline phosphatase D family protein [Polyangiaceae bacterium]|nr:alkaline phosphatase D family protein [Myxococcales bacterium]MCB9584906.1 alkaline phosphatase D family protein [Polyangiaceae bacterium]MCB9607521.1 alkaline phosphatase D family protein [Polyangiaceae bacterium]
MGSVLRTSVLRSALYCALLSLWLPACNGCSKRAAPTGPELATGLMTGEVDDHSAVVWGRGTGAGWLQVELTGAEAQRLRAPLAEARDFTARIQVSGLKASTDYTYKAWLSVEQDGGAAPANAKLAMFRTAPVVTASERVRFGFSGDLGGQNACRDAQEGYPIFNALSDERLQFFIGLGDMIYGDGVCRETGRFGNAQVRRDIDFATKRAEYWRFWRYNRGDSAFQQLLQNTGYYAVWDDHEVVNDFGPQRDQRGNPPYRVDQHLMPEGLAAFLDYHAFDAAQQAGKRLYRSRRWGKHVELFFLDTRQYRSVASLPGADPKKSMLGPEQLEWLIESLRKSDATWKLIVNSVPIAIPTGWPPDGPRDGWANFGGPTGYEVEFSRLVAVLPELKPANVVFLTTDVHFAAAYVYRPFAKEGVAAEGASSQFSFLELVSGPLSAGLFPKLVYDDSFGAERLFIHAPLDGEPAGHFDKALGWYNYAVVDVDPRGNINVTYKDAKGRLIQELELEPGRAPRLTPGGRALMGAAQSRSELEGVGDALSGTAAEDLAPAPSASAKQPAPGPKR